jgi:hypothetical protein
MNIFEHAIREMQSSQRRVFGPVSFQSYLKSAGIDDTKTAPNISIDNLRRLHPILRDARTMVFRLGAPEGERNTHFALAEYVHDWTDYFFIDDQIFKDIGPEAFISPVPFRRLYAFHLLPSFTETSLVNLAAASGLLAHALKLEDQDLFFTPATGQSTYSFEVRPHPKLGVTWKHSKGQVQIDAVFIARRAGKETVFIVEAKAGNDLDSLAKHKIVYPLLALRPQLPPYLPVVGVYLRALCQNDGIHFYLAECDFEAGGDSLAIASLQAKCLGRYVVAGIGV